MFSKTLTALCTALVLATVMTAASAQTRTQPQRHSPNPAWDVYVGGKYVGSDPDPMIRHQLRRENSDPLND